MQDLPRHLGQHSGGMVICAGLLNHVVPIERASMPGRTVVQWDKEDCADLGLIKVDLLGLGMMAVLKDCIELIPRHHGEQVDLAALPEDPLVYETLRKADTVGMFQVESRAQMASIPHNAPTRFYDLVVQVAIIRPGPIVGKMMHPYMRRRPAQRGGHISASLAGTGARAHAGRAAVSGAVAAHGHDRGQLFGRRSRGVAPRRGHAPLDAADEGPGRPFARGDDAQRHRRGGAGPDCAKHLFVRHVWISRKPRGQLRADRLRLGLPQGALSCRFHLRHAEQPAHGLLLAGGAGEGCAAARAAGAAHRRQRSAWLCTVERESDGSRSLRLGFNYVKGMRQALAEALLAARNRDGAFASVGDLARRVPELGRGELVALARIGALNSLGAVEHRRDALWQVEEAGRPVGPLLRGRGARDGDGHAPNSFENRPVRNMPLRKMTTDERLAADYAGTGLTTGPHPMTYHRAALRSEGILAANELANYAGGRKVRIAGCVIARQRPGTAKGFVFLSLEDETGIANVILTPDVFERDRVVVTRSRFLRVEGPLQNQDGVIHVKGERIEPLEITSAAIRSHDFH